MIGSRHKQSAKSGFTLIELLISLALLSIIAAGLIASLGFSIRVYDRSGEIGENAAQITHRLHLREWLSQAMEPKADATIPIVFEGTEQSLLFISRAEAAFAPDASALRIEVRYENSSLSFVANTLDQTGQSMMQIEGLLTENVTGVRIEYLVTPEGTKEWKSRWTSEQGLPAAIKISASSGSTPDWPDFIVRTVFRSNTQ